MKSIVFSLLISCSPLLGFAQLNEWLNQKQTQLKYLAQQIAANKIYLVYLEKGYKIAKNGLDKMSELKKGHFKLDDDFFKSLRSVNSLFAKNPTVMDLNLRLSRIEKRLETIDRMAQNSSFLQRSEISAITKLAGGMESSGFQEASVIKGLLLSGDFKMTDDERLKRLQQSKLNVIKLESDVESLYLSVKYVLGQRKGELMETERIGEFY